MKITDLPQFYCFDLKWHISMDRYLILSDFHLGIKDATLNNPSVTNALINYIYEYGPWKSVIFNGDLLDLNMSSFQLSVEGGALKNTRILGLRQFLANIKQAGDCRKIARNWIYIPGNHDYLVWTLLSNQKIYLEPLASGEKLNTRRSGLKEGVWKEGSAFISGVFPEEIRNKVTVAYPDHVIRTKKEKIVISHGHYLDSKQTLFKRLKELVKETGDHKAAIEKMYVETDRFQVLTHTLTYSSEFQKYMNYLFRTGRFARSLGIALSNIVRSSDSPVQLSVSPLRGEKMNVGQLSAVEFYLKYFRNYKKAPDCFIYGHTHAQGHASTDKIPESKRLYPEKDIMVYNTGGFIAKGDIAGTFIRIDVPQKDRVKIISMQMDNEGNILA